jgi:hypothetical protein
MIFEASMNARINRRWPDEPLAAGKQHLQTSEKVQSCKYNRQMETSEVEGIGDRMV